MKRLLLVLVVVLAAAAWFFVSPLFIDRTVDESFDFMLPDGSLDVEKTMSLSEEKREEMKSEIMDAAAGAPDRTKTEPMPVEAPRALARGDFVDVDAVHKGSGQATLYELPDGRHVLRFEDFRTTNGPALVVYLARHPSPATAADVTDLGYVDLGELKGNVGNQNYVIPAGTRVEEYGSVVIWCVLFDVLFSPAALHPVD